MNYKSAVGLPLNEKILDVGCGGTKVYGAIGIDQFPLANVDLIHNLNVFPWPLEKESFDRIIFSHSISHLSDISMVLLECHRILRNGGKIEIVAPHYSSDNFNTDPTHKIHLGKRSMNYYVDNIDFGYRYIPNDCKYELLCSSLSFREATTSWRNSIKLNPYNLIGFEWLANKFSRVYERFFCWIFPASEVYFLLQKK